MKWTPYGESDWTVLCRDEVEAARLSSSLRSRPGIGVVDAWAAFDRVMVCTHPGVFDPEVVDNLDLVASAAARSRHEIPVAFDGEDLDEVLSQLGLSKQDFVKQVCGKDLTVSAVGFSFGFGYLTGLDHQLCGLKRRSSPRTRVPAGSLAFAEDYCAVYPESTPGGWLLVGRTDHPMVDRDEEWCLLSVGDLVRFSEKVLELEDTSARTYHPPSQAPA